MGANGELAKTSEPPKRLTPLQVAQRLGVGVVVVRRWIELGHLRAIDAAVQPGPHKRRRWRISIEDLAAFEQARANGALVAVAAAISRAKPDRPKEATEWIT